MNTLTRTIVTCFCLIFFVQNAYAVDNTTLTSKKLSRKLLQNNVFNLDTKNLHKLFADINNNTDPSLFNNVTEVGLAEVSIIIGLCSLLACGVVAWCCCPNENAGFGVIYGHNTVVFYPQEDIENQRKQN